MKYYYFLYLYIFQFKYKQLFYRVSAFATNNKIPVYHRHTSRLDYITATGTTYLMPNTIQETLALYSWCETFWPWYCCHEYVSFLDTTLGISWRVPNAEQEMLTLPEHLLSPLVFIEVHVVLYICSLFHQYWPYSI